MRRVEITKQDIMQPKAVIFGLSIKQIVIMGIGFAISIATFCLMFLLAKIDVNITMTVVFIELALSSGFSVIRVNGISMISWLYVMLKGPIYRPYQSKGMLSCYDEKEKKQ